MSLAGEVATEAHPVGVVRDDVVEDSAETDARVAAIMHLQQLQHKQEVMQLLEAHPVTNADTEFRMQLEELVRDHLNTCMALASHSNSHDNSSHSPPFGLRGDSSDSHHHLLEHSVEQCHHHHHHHHQYHLVVEDEEGGDGQDDRIVQQSGDNAETPNGPRGLLRPHTGILGRWDERQGSESTVIERQVREAELLALSSLHTVSTLDASFLQGSPSPRTESFVERPQRLSPLVQMWRELEGEQGDREANQLSDRTRTRGGEMGVVQILRECEGEQETEIHRTDAPDETGIAAAEAAAAAESDVEDISHLSPGNEPEILGTVASVEVEPLADTEPFVQETSSSNRTHEIDRSQNGVQQLDGDRERVQEMVRRWMRDSGAVNSEASEAVQPSSRVEWLAEGERERVRQMAREWVRVSNFESTPVPSQSHAVHPLNMGQFEAHQRGQEVSPPGDSVQTPQNPIRWDAERQREMVLELLMRSEQERQRELAGLSEHRTVSEFALRNRLQSFLRGRFLRSGIGTDVDRPPSLAAGEIGQLRQRRAVSGLREGFRSRLETIVRSQSNPGFTDGQRRQQESLPAVPQSEQESLSTVPQSEQESLPTVPQSDVPVTHSEGGVGRDRPAPRRAQWTNDLQSLEDATAYNMELRELLARQSVTTMLASEFRDRLDQLIRSFIHSQGRTPQPWNISRPRQAASPTQQDQVQQGNPVINERRINSPQAAPLVIPPPPPPPPHPLWHQQPMVLEQPPPATWARPAPQRSAEMEWETTSRALRTDVTVLQRGLNEIREMMEASIQMQFELQRSIRQEISGALQRMYIGKALPTEALDGSKWTAVKKGTCCICCDKQIDCVLYRCGHMCTCVKCANELQKNSGRCPMCRASILEVVHAFTVI